MSAPCADKTDLFFSGATVDVLAAIDICGGCPNAEPCRQGAQERGEIAGVWGGWVAPKGRIPRVKPPGRPMGKRPQRCRDGSRPRVACESLVVGTQVRVREDLRLVAWTVTKVELVEGMLRIGLACGETETSVVRFPDDFIELEATRWNTSS